MGGYSDYYDWVSKRNSINKETGDITSIQMSSDMISTINTSKTLKQETGFNDSEIQEKLKHIKKLNNETNEMNDLNSKINASLAIKQRETFSALVKMSILGFLITICILTILIKNETLYDVVCILLFCIFGLYFFFIR